MRYTKFFAKLLEEHITRSNAPLLSSFESSLLLIVKNGALEVEIWPSQTYVVSQTILPRTLPDDGSMCFFRIILKTSAVQIKSYEVLVRRGHFLQSSARPRCSALPRTEERCEESCNSRSAEDLGGTFLFASHVCQNLMLTKSPNC